MSATVSGVTVRVTTDITAASAIGFSVPADPWISDSTKPISLEVKQIVGALETLKITGALEMVEFGITLEMME